MKPYLRSGYTTGICGAAAAKAAAVFLLIGRRQEKIEICLETGEKAEFDVECFWEGISWCRVRKDAGDDPDVTNGVWVCAGVSFADSFQWEELCREGRGYVLLEYPGLYLNGGPGIGVVTKPGLSCPVGHYAINPVPRRQILGAVEEVRKRAAYEGRLQVCMAIPEGVWLAEKTFNPKLGIVGGISILGTTGIVKPMSEEALVETIRLEIRMKAAAGERLLLLTPGNYGERFLQQEKNIKLGEAVRCSNFVRASVEMAAKEGFERILLAGHIGKLVKVAKGAGNTHSKCGDGRMEEMERLAREVVERMAEEKRGGEEENRAEEKSGSEQNGARDTGWKKKQEELLEKVRRSNTTEEAVGYLKDAGLAERVLAKGAEKVKMQVESWGGGQIKAEVMVFSSAHQIVGQSSGADYLVHRYISGQRSWRGVV